jgi:hypothetical protein
MQIICINDPDFIREFCFGDCHLLACVAHRFLSNKGFEPTILTCHLPMKKHTFIKLVIGETCYYLDGSGVHTSLLSVFDKYGVKTQGLIPQLPIGVMDHRDDRLIAWQYASDRHQHLCQTIEDPQRRERAFAKVKHELANEYFTAIDWHLFTWPVQHNS